MMLLKGVPKALASALLRQGRRGVGHIKDMDEENVRVLADQMDKEGTVVKTSRVYKPTYTVEFNR